MTTVTYTVPAISAPQNVQICKLADGRWFHTIEEITSKSGDNIPQGTALYVVNSNSTTKWWVVADENGKTWEVSKLEGASPQ